MALQTPTAIGQQRVFGDCAWRTYTLGTVADGDTLVVNETRLEIVIPGPTTSVPVGWTLSAVTETSTTITFHSGGSSWTGVVGVLARLR